MKTHYKFISYYCTKYFRTVQSREQISNIFVVF